MWYKYNVILTVPGHTDVLSTAVQALGLPDSNTKISHNTYWFSASWLVPAERGRGKAVINTQWNTWSQIG